MSKEYAVITEVQARHIQWIKAHYNKAEIDHLLDKHAQLGGQWSRASRNFALRDLPVSQVARAIHRGYEVRETYELGQWIRDMELGITQVVQVEEGGIWVGEDRTRKEWRGKDSKSYRAIRPATEEEVNSALHRRKLKKVSGFLDQLDDEEISILKLKLAERE